jgi:hypothetical protein
LNSRIEDDSHIVVVSINITRSAEDSPWGTPSGWIGASTSDVFGNAASREEVGLDGIGGPLHSVDSTAIIVESLAISVWCVILDLATSGIRWVSPRVLRPEIAVVMRNANGVVDDLTGTAQVVDLALPSFVLASSVSSSKVALLVVSTLKDVEFAVVRPVSGT